MIPRYLTKDLKDRLKCIKGQIEGILKMLDESNDPEQILNQFKSVNKALVKSECLLLDDVYRKTLAIKIAQALDICPGNCGQEKRIADLQKDFQKLPQNKLPIKIREVEKIHSFFRRKRLKESVQKLSLKIKNMSCQGCAEDISDKLKEVAGVEKVKASFINKNVNINFCSDTTNEYQLIAVLKKSGYSVSVECNI